MRKILYIMTAIVLIILGSCTRELVEDSAGARGTGGYLSAEIQTRLLDAEDNVEKVRFVIFDDASSVPVLSFNDIVPVEPGKDSESFTVTLEVSRNRDKDVYVIVNEPAGLVSTLAGITSPWQLQDMEFQMDDVFNANHTAPEATGIPMTGVARGVAVTAANGSKDTAAPVKGLKVLRAVARVDLLLKTDGKIGGQLTTDTKVTLSRSCASGYLFARDQTAGFGHVVPTVADPNIKRQWTPSTTVTLRTEADHICHFYVPERTCSADNDADKLELRIEGISTSDGFKRSGGTLIKTFTGKAEPIAEINRNNRYVITAILEEQVIDVECEVAEWNDRTVGVIIDPQYYLRVSADQVSITHDKPATITLVTNFPGDSSRDYPPGISDEVNIRYYSAVGMEYFEGVDGDLWGWLNVALSGGDLLKRTATLAADNDYVTDPDKKGYYALAEFKAGNLTKKIKVTYLNEYSLRVIDEWGADITELAFGYGGTSNPIQAQSVTVLWTGTDNCVISRVDGATAFEHAAGSNIPSGTIHNGKQMYSIKAADASQSDIDKSVTKQSTLTFTIETDDGPVSKSLTLTQLRYYILTDAQSTYGFGSDNSFNVICNTDWVITAVSDPKGILVNGQALVGTTGGPNTSPGDPFHFTTAAYDSDKVNKTVTFTFSNTAGKFADHDVTFTTKASTKPTDGVLAPPNVLGVGAESGKLTLDGSKEFADGTAGETVYVVHFKWGSLVALATTSGIADTYDAGDVAWVPDGFNVTITDSWSSVPYTSGNSITATNNPAAGLGDPCREAWKGSSKGNWKMPAMVGNSWFETLNGGPEGWVVPAGPPFSVGGRYATYGGQFYPAASSRDEYNNGNFIAITGSLAYYWSSSISNNYPMPLRFDTQTVWSGGAYGRQNAFTVRCVPN